MSEWKALYGIEEVTAARKAGMEIEVDILDEWKPWSGEFDTLLVHVWFKDLKFRARPRKPSEHELKTDPQVFDDVLEGRKTFEIRKDDRGFRVGDTLKLRKTLNTGAEMAAGAPLLYSTLPLFVDVTYILRGPIYGLADGWVIMGIKPKAWPSETKPAKVLVKSICWRHTSGRFIWGDDKCDPTNSAGYQRFPAGDIEGEVDA